MYILRIFKIILQLWPDTVDTPLVMKLSTPPLIYGSEVPAEWKRSRNGEVIMTVKMPHDTVDMEVYIKTPRGHSGIQMDQWISATWRKK